MDDAGTPWEKRAIRSVNAVSTAARTAEDGHVLRADLYGSGARRGQPHRLVLTCETRLGYFGEEFERWPTIPELLDAADFMTPGTVLDMRFFGNPEGVPRVEVPPGTARCVEVSEVGELKQPGKIELVQA